MSRLGYIIFILLLIGYQHFELTAQTRLKSPKEGTSTVSGRVILKGEPAQGVTVVLDSQMTGSPLNPGPTPGVKTVDITVAEARKAYDVYGRVVNAETGKGVAQAWISYSSVSADGRRTGGGGSKGERSDENGEFHLRGVLPGKFALSAEGDQDSEFYSDPVICEINNSDLHGIEIKVRQGGSISGVIAIEGTNDPAILSKLSKIQAAVIWFTITAFL